MPEFSDADADAIRDAGRGHLIDGGPHRGQVQLRDEARRAKDEKDKEQDGAGAP